MPTILETEIGEFEFPNDLTIDQINEWERTELPSLRERVSKGAFSDLASRFPRDVAVAGADTIQGSARGFQLLRDFTEVYNLQQAGAKAAMAAPVGEEHAAWTAAHNAANAKAKELQATREQRLAENPIYKFGAESKKNAQEFYQTNPLREGSVPAMVSQAVASLPPLIAAGAAGPLAPAVAGLAYASMAGQQGAQEAIEMGHPEKADEAFLLFAGLGALSEAALGYPIAFLRKVNVARLAGVTPETFGKSVKNWFSSTTGGRITREGLEGFAREAPQEMVEQGGQNVIASTIVGYDPDRPAMQGVPQAGAIGAVVGTGVGAVGGAAMAIDAARARRAAGAQVPAMLRSIEPAQPVVEQFPATPEQRAAEAAGLPIPLTPPGPTAEQLMADEAAAAVRARQVDPYFADEVVQEPVPAPPATTVRRRSPAQQSESLRRDLTAVQPLVVEAQPIAGTPQPLTVPPTPTVNESLSVQPEAQQGGVAPKIALTKTSEESFRVANERRAQEETELRSVAPEIRQFPYLEAQLIEARPFDERANREWNRLPKAAQDRIENEWMPESEKRYISLNDSESFRKTAEAQSELEQQSTVNGLIQAYAHITGNMGRDLKRPVLHRLVSLLQEKGLSSDQVKSELTTAFRQRYGANSEFMLAETLQDIAQEARRGLPVANQPRETPNAIIAGEEKSVSQRVGADAQVQVNGQDRLVAPEVQEAGTQTSGGNQLLSSKTETTQAQGAVDWFANLGSVNPEDLETAKAFRKDAAKLAKESEKLIAEAKEIEKRIIRTTGPRYERGKIKKSANKKEVAEYQELLRRASELDNARRTLEDRTNPAEVASAIRRASDPSLPLLNRLNARAELFGLQGQREPEEFLAELDRVNREEVRRLYPDASPAEVERLRGPVRRAFMGNGDINAAVRLDPELNLNVQRWGEIAAADTGASLENFPEDLQAAIRKARDLRVAGRNALTPITREETDRILAAIPKAKAAAEAEIAKEQQQAQEASAKMEREFTNVIQTENARDAKAAKTILVRELEQALSAAPDEQHGKATVTIEIPGDGTFKILNNKAAIQTVLDNARRIATTTGLPRNYSQRSVTKEEGKQFAEEARMTPEEIAAFRPNAKYSVTLSEPTGQPAVTPADIERAFQASQGFEVEPVSWTMVAADGSERVSNSFLVKLPNGQAILVDPTHDVIHFDPTKAAADWGFAQGTQLVARGSYRRVEITGLSRVGLIDLVNTSGPATLSHEKFHALFDMALTEEERAAILSRYNTEEKAAEAFRRSEGFTRTFWEKIRRFIEWLSNLVRGDAFRKLRAPLSTEASQPAAQSEPKYSLEEVFRSKKSLEDFISKPTISAEEETSLRRQAGTQAGMVPDAIAEEVRNLNPDDAIEKRMAPLLDFVLKLHGMAPALELKRVLADPNIPEDTKQAAISGVLLQVEHVRAQTNNLEEKLQEANSKLANAIQKGGKITAERMVEARAKQIADNLISRYRAYLTAQAANLPANQNLAAERSELINRMDETLTEMEIGKLSIKTRDAIEAIAKRISELPVNEGPQAVIDAIRQKGILRGVTGETITDLLTAEHGGLPPLLLNPAANQMLIDLAALQKKAETYAKQIEVIEQAFRGKGQAELTPVELKKFADTYRKFRNQQADAAKAIREMDQQIKKADDDVQVYGRSHDILARLQSSPQFQQQFETAINRPGGEIFRDVLGAKNPELEKEYTSPLVQTRDDGTKFQNKYRVKLAPDRVADEETIGNMQMLVAEIDEFLHGDVNPVERKTWETRRDYIVKYLLQPKFSQKVPMLKFGSVNLNLFGWVQFVAGGRARGPRSELEKMAFRAANEANATFRTADQALIGYKLISNNKVFGDEATKVAILEAVASHGTPSTPWTVDRIKFWDENVLNPILASGQTAGQMRLKAGDFIPGRGIKITPEDMEVAHKEKRYSQGIVQTTQGTAKGLSGLLIDNPILIKTTILGRKGLRGAISPGPYTMARRFSTWGKLFSNAWTKATPAGRKKMVTDGEHFDKAVLGYVSTTNPEFNNTSALTSVYEKFASEAKQDENYQVNSLDQLVDRLATIAVEQKLFPTVAEAAPKIEEKLLSEVGEHVAAIQKHFEEEGYTDDTPQTAMQYASAKSAFTTARKNMMAPDPYYDYTLTSGSDRIGFVAAGYQQFQLRQIDALKALKKALDRKEVEFKEEIGRLEHKGMTARKAKAVVQKKSETQLDRTRFSMQNLHDHNRVIEKVLKDLTETVIDVRDPNDSIVLQAAQRVTSNLSSSLLSSPTAIANNLFGGIAANSVILRNLGRASLVGTPIKATAHTTGALVKKVLLTFAPTTAIGKVARSNIPVVKEMAAMVDNQLRNWTQQYLEMQERGLVAPTDMRNRMRAQAALKTRAGAIEFDAPPLIAAVPNWLESIPGMRQFLGHLRDKVPRLGDEVVNMGAAGLQTSEVFDFLKNQAVKAFEGREAAGDNINASDYFTTEENLLSPKELGMVESTGFRDSDSLRQQFEVVGNLDGFLRDYYNRQKAAPEGEKHTVPLFKNPADEGAVLYDMNAHGNIATAGFTPPSMAGVGQRGLIKKMLFMFQNYVLRQAAQAERLADKDLRDPKGWRESYALWGIFATLIVWAIAGMLATEIGVPATKLITGRSPSRVTAANVIADPDAAMLARYVGMALGNNLPYYGQVISQMLGNPGYGSKWDAANLIPIAGLVRDVNTAITRTSQTGDPIFPAVDFLNRWLPPVSPVLRLLPDVEGDIEARNAARALRVVGPSEGMELAGGGGGQSVQTPASAAIRRLMSAAYRGDREGIQQAFDAAVREKTAQGSADPERAVLQSLASREPARMVFGRAITPAEEARLIGRMSGGQRASYSNAQDAFSLINQTLGTKLTLTTEPKARSTTRGQASRRSLFSDSTTGSRSRRRRLGGRGRSGFRRLQIRGASQRKRRSPARLSFAS